MKSFENIDVKSVAEAVALLQKFHQTKKEALVLGGGSEALQLMKDNVLTPDYVVNLKTIPGLSAIKEERGGFRIGALTTLADIEDHPGVREKLLILSAAAGEAASPQIRNAGTSAATSASGRSAGTSAHRISLACAKGASSVIRLPATAAFTLFWAAARAISSIRQIPPPRWSLWMCRSRSPDRQVKEPCRWKSFSSCLRWTIGARIS
jgi:CO/xanthine dehydrogenase FAD-binding subunit